LESTQVVCETRERKEVRELELREKENKSRRLRLLRAKNESAPSD